jgi:hypothetical protein
MLPKISFITACQHCLLPFYFPATADDCGCIGCKPKGRTGVSGLLTPPVQVHGIGAAAEG